MKIERIVIDGFGCHRDLTLSLRGDLNILYGKNESGKSTLLAFIEAIFYGFNDSESAPLHQKRSYWFPWQGAPFGGSLVFTNQGHRFSVLAAWGTSPLDDRISVTEESSGEKVELPFGKTVGSEYLNLSRMDFETFVLGLHAGDDESACLEEPQMELLAKWTASKASQSASVTSAEIRLSAMQTALSEKISRLTQVKATEENRLEKRFKTEEDALKADARIALLETQRRELAKKETAPQSIDAMTHAVNLLETQKKAHHLYHRIEDLRNQYVETHRFLKLKKRPWTVLLILFMIVSVLVVTACLLPFEWGLEWLGFNPLSEDTRTLTCVVTCALLFLFSLSLILVRTGGKGELYALDEKLQYREQALCELLSLESSNPDEIADAMDTLDEQCKNATQCLAAIDRDRKDKAELTAKLSALDQKITYDRAQMETLYRFMQNNESPSDMRDRILSTEDKIAQYQRHKMAVALAMDLLARAEKKQQSDLAPRLATQSGDMLGNMTSGRYKEVELSRNFEPAVSHQGIVRNGKHYRGATGGQIRLAVKLAELKLLADAGNPLPLLLDEPFAVYDDDRRRTSTETLLQFAKENNIQILITSSYWGAPYNTDYNQYALSI